MSGFKHTPSASNNAAQVQAVARLMRSSCMSEIIPRLYLGDYVAAINKSEISRLGITDMITIEIKKLRPDEIAQTVKRYLYLNVLDHPKQDILSHFELSFDFIDSALKVPTNKVFVHCVAGISRSASIVIAYLMKSQSLDYMKALEMVKQKRLIVDPNEGFIRQLSLYDKMRFTIDIGNTEYRYMILEALVFEYRLLALNFTEKLPSSIFSKLAPKTAVSSDYLKKISSLKQNVCLLFEQYFEKISLRNVNKYPNIYKQDQSFKCGKCRAIVFYQVNVIENKKIEGPELNASHLLPIDDSSLAKQTRGPLSPPIVCKSTQLAGTSINEWPRGKACPFIFIEPQPWMTQAILEAKGNLDCYKCKKKLGKFDWTSQESCSCDLHTSHMNLNLFKISRKHIDGLAK